jgi:hypothetical protein
MGRGKSKKSVELIVASQNILAEIQPAAVRAVCYRLFVAGYIPNMGRSATNGVSKQLTWARENGMIPWDWIVDETRQVERDSQWGDTEQFVDTVRGAYRRDRWLEQPELVEV